MISGKWRLPDFVTNFPETIIVCTIVTSHTKTGNNSTWKEISYEDLNRWENKNKLTNKWRAINRERRKVLFAIDALLTAQDVQRAVRVL